VVQCIASIALASVLYVAIRQVFAQHMQVDEFFGFLTALMLIPAPLRSLVNMSGPLQQGIAAGQSVFELLDQPTEGSGGRWRIAARAATSSFATCRSPTATRARCCTT
jgi:subfamily B ATP-binding cassette protein MsbA